MGKEENHAHFKGNMFNEESEMADSCSEADSLEMKIDDMDLYASSDFSSDCASDSEGDYQSIPTSFNLHSRNLYLECHPNPPLQDTIYNGKSKQTELSSKLFEVPQLFFNRLQTVRFDFEELRRDRSKSLSNSIDETTIDCSSILNNCILRRKEIKNRRKHPFECNASQISIRSSVIYVS